jgi:hypothetical protein
MWSPPIPSPDAPATPPVTAWVNVSDRLPELGRWVKVWGEHCMDGHVAPVARRKLNPGNRAWDWFWDCGEWRGTSFIYLWFDGPASEPPDVVPVSGPIGVYSDVDEIGARLDEIDEQEHP